MRVAPGRGRVVLHRARQRGFTLVELIALMALVGILGAVVAPRFFDAGGFGARGFADGAAAFLRHAQKLAIARHGQVHVQPEGAGLMLCRVATSPCPGGQEIAGPEGQAPYRIDPPGGVALSLAGGAFAFDAQGRPDGGRTLAVTGGGGAFSLTVEAETGYVH